MFYSIVLSKINKGFQSKYFLALSIECRIKGLADCMNAVKKMTGIELSLKTLKKAIIYFTNKELGGSHKGKFVSKHKTAQLQESRYDKPPREEVKKYARQVAKVFTFKRKWKLTPS